jgi:hypothetical protein
MWSEYWPGFRSGHRMTGTHVSLVDFIYPSTLKIAVQRSQTEPAMIAVGLDDISL